MTRKEEEQLLSDLEGGVYVDKQIDSSEIKKYQEYAKYTKELNLKKQTTIRFSVQDLAIIKTKAKESGIGYQNLIQALVHNYAIGKISLKI
jgi:predicted DNA binding CopG/RHH family protein